MILECHCNAPGSKWPSAETPYEEFCDGHDTKTDFSPLSLRGTFDLARLH